MPVTTPELQQLLDEVKLLQQQLEALIAETKLEEERALGSRGVPPRLARIR